MKEEKKRELLPDVLRGFAVFLVVLGHSIQEGSGNAFLMEAKYFDDRLYQLIYSFHMPLFMLLSGWFAWLEMNKAGTKQERILLLKKRIQSLLIPVFGWTALDFIRTYAEYEAKGYPHSGIGQAIIQYLLSALQNYWFLWAVLWSFLIVYVMHFYFHDSRLLYTIGFAATFFTPDGLGLGAYKYMMPYYIAAFYFHEWFQSYINADKKDEKYAKWRKAEGIYHRLSWLFIAGIGVLFGWLFIPYYTRDSFIYLTGYKLIGKDVLRQLSIDLYRMLIGFAGSGLMILLWKQIICLCKGYRFLVLAKLGQDSMGIYIISGYLLIYILAPMTKNMTPSYVYNMIETVAVLALSVLLTEVLGHIPVLRRLVGKVR